MKRFLVLVALLIPGTLMLTGAAQHVIIDNPGSL